LLGKDRSLCLDVQICGCAGCGMFSSVNDEFDLNVISPDHVQAHFIQIEEDTISRREFGML